LGPLTQLDLKHLHLGQCGRLFQFFVTKVARQIPNAVLGGADLKHDIGSSLQMVGRDSTLSSIHPATGPFGSHGEGQHGGLG
jgi:hypothetical protein